MSKEKNEPVCCDEYKVHPSLLKIALDSMPDTDDINALAELFKVFGDPSRLKIMFALYNTEICVCDLAEGLGMTQSAVSHQLRVLKQSKLVSSRREGKSIFYSLADDHVSAIIAQGREHIEE